MTNTVLIESYNAFIINFQGGNKEMYCPKCGMEIADDSRFCMGCGEKIDDLTVSESTENTAEEGSFALPEYDGKFHLGEFLLGNLGPAFLITLIFNLEIYKGIIIYIILILIEVVYSFYKGHKS